MNVQTIYDLINTVAPFDTQMEGDNSGLLVGSPAQEVKNILFALDATESVIDEAAAIGVQLIVTHHPLMFNAFHTLTDETYEGRLVRRLVRENISLIAAHTNWDQSILSGSAASAEAIGVINLRQSGYLFTGDVPNPVTAEDVKKLIETRIDAPVRMYGDGNQIIASMSFGGGAYGEGYRDALTAGSQAYLTGEIRHHEIIDAVARGLVIYDAGHYASEAPMIPRMIQYLRDKLSDYTIDIIQSKHVPFTGALL